MTGSAPDASPHSAAGLPALRTHAADIAGQVVAAALASPSWGASPAQPPEQPQAQPPEAKGDSRRLRQGDLDPALTSPVGRQVVVGIVELLPDESLPWPRVRAPDHQAVILKADAAKTAVDPDYQWITTADPTQMTRLAQKARISSRRWSFPGCADR